jgi:hypothetical protein
MLAVMFFLYYYLQPFLKSNDVDRLAIIMFPVAAEHYVQGVQQQSDASQPQAATFTPLLLRLVLFMFSG